MAYVTIIAMLALIEYLYFGVQVGGARGRTGVQAPAVSGHPTRRIKTRALAPRCCCLAALL